MALRIKENIDLKELEKFGFRKHYRLNGYENNIYWILEKDKIIRISMNGQTENMLLKDNPICSCIYDLIKADMVEKIEE